MIHFEGKVADATTDRIAHLHRHHHHHHRQILNLRTIFSLFSEHDRNVYCVSISMCEINLMCVSHRLYRDFIAAIAFSIRIENDLFALHFRLLGWEASVTKHMNLAVAGIPCLNVTRV